MSRVFLVSAAAMTALMASCRNLDSPTAANQSQLVVQGVMDTHTSEQMVLIYRARTGAPLAIGAISNEQPVLDASVEVTLPNGDRMIAKSEQDGSYDFMPEADGLDVTQGGTYVLHVRTAEGEEVNGSTTVPTPPPHVQGLFRRPLVRARDTLRLSWPRVPNARAYEVLVGNTGYRTFTDTAIAIPGTALTIAGDMVFPPGVFVDVVISAVDVNYYDYYRAQSDPFAGAPPSHLAGAVGVFGAIAPILDVQFLVE